MSNTQVRYFYNKETNVVYRIVNNLCITMYYRSKKAFGVCASTARDILDAYYQGGDMWYDDMFKDWRGYVNIVFSK